MRLVNTELGGVKIVCTVGDEKEKCIQKRLYLPMKEKEAEKAYGFFIEKGIDLGLAYFGYVNPDEGFKTYRYYNDSQNLDESTRIL